MNAYEQMEATNVEQALRDTWGHLGPEKGRTYAGRIVYAVGAYDGATVLVCDIPSSPWFYDALHDWLFEQPEQDEGCVYEWRGTFKDYKFDGKTTKVWQP